jgi:hypothetical protein
MEEIYKEHPKFKCSVSNYGNVKGQRGNIMIGNKIRYHRITLTERNKHRKWTISVHRLVAELFIGEIEGFVINHKDGNKLNNHVNNLEIVTIKQNIQHAFDTGLSVGNIGENNGNSILTEKQVLEIYACIYLGDDNNKIAENYNINFRTVSQIRNGTKWKHLYKKYMNDKIPSKNCKYSLEICFKIIDDILNNNLKNIEISKKYDIEPSLISRIRSKNTWTNIWLLYNRSATTISKESTLQAYGNGKAENPTNEGYDIV